MKTYNVFLEYYDKIVRWINSPLEEEVQFLSAIITKYNKNKFSDINILETACWTGTVAKEFIKKWFKIIWLDINEKMLEIAKTNIPKDNLVLWDMTNFDLWKKFDVLLCNYNSICHLLEWKQWKNFFIMSYNHLKEWWLFIFDINTLFEFENITREFAQFYNFWEDSVCLEMFKKEWYYEWLIKIFKKEEDWRFDLIKEIVKENSFPIKIIKKELKNSWFEILEVLDFHYWDVSLESERVYFVCKKK
jgi:hypothetical protein